MQLVTVAIDKPETTNFILGQTHFIKSVEELHEALAFCEASGKCLVRWSGTDPAMVELAQKNAQSLAAGHCFIIFLGEDGSGDLPRLLRHRQPDRSHPRRDAAGARYFGRGGRLSSREHRG